MTFGVRIIISCAGLFLFVIVFELVRRKRFREELSLAWFLVALAIMSSAVADLVMDPLAQIIGIGYPPALYFAWIIFCLIVTLLYFSVVISDLKGKIKELSQKVALMQFEIDKNHKENNSNRSDP